MARILLNRHRSIFGFYVKFLDNIGTAATLTISNFRAPTSTHGSAPERASLALMALGMAAARRRLAR